MSGGLVPVPRSLTAIDRREDRAVARQLNGIDRNTSLAVARLEARATVEVAKIQAIGAATQQALTMTGVISTIEGQLAKICPSAAGRLAAIADNGAMAAIAVIADMPRRLG